LSIPPIRQDKSAQFGRSAVSTQERQSSRGHRSMFCRHYSATHVLIEGMTLTVLSGPAPVSSSTRSSSPCRPLSRNSLPHLPWKAARSPANMSCPGLVDDQQRCHYRSSSLEQHSGPFDSATASIPDSRCYFRGPTSRQLCRYIFDGTPYTHPSNLRHGVSKTECDNRIRIVIGCSCGQLSTAN
jgi:hypothetical protein